MFYCFPNSPTALAISVTVGVDVSIDILWVQLSPKAAPAVPQIPYLWDLG